MNDLPKHWTCECGHENPFTPYAHAHWDIELITRCKGCDKQHTVLRGVAIPEKTTRKVKK